MTPGSPFADPRQPLMELLTRRFSGSIIRAATMTEPGRWKFMATVLLSADVVNREGRRAADELHAWVGEHLCRVPVGWKMKLLQFSQCMNFREVSFAVAFAQMTPSPPEMPPDEPLVIDPEPPR